MRIAIFSRATLGALTVFAAQLGAQTTNWTLQRPQTSPFGRGTALLAYDSQHGQVVLFSGLSMSGPVGFRNDTWTWDGTAWTVTNPAQSPPPRSNSAMAYDSTHGQMVVFGGLAPSSTDLSDTWLWDGSNWTESPQTGPSERGIHAMAYDSQHGQVVMFGGQDPNGLPLNDTWLWDGTSWTLAQPQVSPPARFGHGMAYDSVHGQVVLFGGNNGSSDLNDTWLWDGTNWTPATPPNSPPAMCFHQMVYDSAHDQVMIFGGGTSDMVFSNTGLLNETWLWYGSNWTQATPANSPSARNRFGMAFDTGHAQAVLFGGRDANGNFLGDTWTFSGAPLVPVVTAVVNGASFESGGVVPGEIATAFGTNLTSSIGINLTSSLPLPTGFLTESLMVNNQPVALFAVDNVNGQQQINFQVPWEIANERNATVVVSNNGTASASISVPVLTAQPGIFNYSVGGSTFGAILHANFQLANTANPANPGETVLIYCTGLGAVSSPPADGAPGNGEHTLLMPTVTIGGANAIVSFSGLAPGFVGLYQINVEVPASLTAGNQTVVVEAGGASSNSVLLPVE